MQHELNVVLNRAADDKKLFVILESMPGSDVEMRPFELRALASALMQAAGDCESLVVREGQFTSQKRVYGLDTLSAAERRVRFADCDRDTEIECYECNGYKVTIYQNALLSDARPSFFATVGSACVGSGRAASIQEAREEANAKAARRKTKVT